MLGEHDHARHRPVQPVRHAQVNSARLLLALFEKPLDAQLQAIDPRRSLRKQARRLVDDQNGAVLVEDVEHEMTNDE
jgi:hypothetical protein